MPAQAVKPKFKTELVVLKQENKNNSFTVLQSTKLHHLQITPIHKMLMTEAEADAFFAACENPTPTPLALFSHFSAVSSWFND